MNKGIFSLLFIALFASAQCESFMRIPFEHGRVSSRSLAELNKAAFTTLHPNNTAAAVTFPDAFQTLNKLTKDTVTDMLIVLWTPYSGVFNNYDKDFTNLICDAATCAPTTGSTTYTKGNMQFYTGGNLANIKMQVKSGDNVAWELQNQLAIYSSNNDAQTIQKFPDYVKSPGAFGFIGLGTDKGADKNFKTDLPIFSIKTSRTRIGSIVFGNDGTSTKNPVKLTADKNWRVTFDSAVVGTVTAKVTTPGVIAFDVNVDGIVMNADLWTPITNQFQSPTGKYKFTYETDVTKKPFGMYTFSYTGSLSDLPDISIKSGDKELFKIPPTVYMRYDEKLKKFALLFTLGSFITDDGNTASPLILGNQFMAQYYTVFEVTKDGPTVTLNEAPLNDWPSSSGSSGGSKGWIIGVVAVVGLAAVGYIVFKNKAANKLSEHLNPK